MHTHYTPTIDGWKKRGVTLTLANHSARFTHTYQPLPADTSRGHVARQLGGTVLVCQSQFVAKMVKRCSWGTCKSDSRYPDVARLLNYDG